MFPNLTKIPSNVIYIYEDGYFETRSYGVILGILYSRHIWWHMAGLDRSNRSQTLIIRKISFLRIDIDLQNIF